MVTSEDSKVTSWISISLMPQPAMGTRRRMVGQQKTVPSPSFLYLNCPLVSFPFSQVNAWYLSLSVPLSTPLRLSQECAEGVAFLELFLVTCNSDRTLQFNQVSNFSENINH
jgi:hypothetical protein